jgi:tetratricopeptide (TPR) repeat protein
MTKGDASQLASLLARRPEWLKLGYRPLAYYEASKGDLADAVDLMERYLPRPPIPAAPSMRDGEAERRFAEDNGDVAAGLALYNQAIAAGRNAAALEILQRLNPAAPAPRPAYLHYLEAQLWLKQGKNDQAWTALAQCPEADHP